ncbi:MAG: murein biosynthesis protein MurJ, partial [Desulfovibrio sp.]|nr:murein biosynthesis protein MurJ [Desulfovibrio sp.]
MPTDARVVSSMPAKHDFLSLSSLLIFFALLSRLLGLFRDLAFAWLLGAGASCDLLAQALRI